MAIAASAPKRARRPCAAALLLAGAIWAIPIGGGLAQEAETLESVQRALEAAQGDLAELDSRQSELAGEIAALQSELIAAGKTTQGLERDLEDIASTLQTLEESERAATDQLAANRRQLTASLGALGWLSLQPPTALVLGPGRAIDRARGQLLLRIAVPALTERSADLKTELEALEGFRADIAQQKSALDQAAAALADENERIAALLDKRRQLADETEAARRALEAQLAKLANEAADLKELIEKLNEITPTPTPFLPEAETAESPALDQPDGGETATDNAQLAALPAKPGAPRPFPTIEIGLTAPVQGRLTGRYGEADSTGSGRRGLDIRTRGGAQVLAPFDGQVVFQGPFRSYGAILIIEHSGGYHSLLAGLGRIDATVGQWLAEGEPVGQMDPAVGTQEPTLYLELRRDGQPIDPSPWLDLR